FWYFFNGFQSDGTDTHVPRYGLLIRRMKSCGRSSGTRTPLDGLSSIHITAATTEIATCMVVAFWCGTSRRDSSMSRSDPVHHDWYGCPIRNAPRMSAPP